MDSSQSDIAHYVRKARLWQLIAIVSVAALFALRKPEHGLAALYGGLVSLFVAWTLSWAALKAEEISRRDPKKGIMVLFGSAAIRFFLIIGLFAIGIGGLGLNPIPVVGTAIVVWLVGVLAPHLGKK